MGIAMLDRAVLDLGNAQLLGRGGGCVWQSVFSRVEDGTTYGLVNGDFVAPEVDSDP